MVLDFLSSYFCLVPVVLAALVYIYLTWNHSYWKKRGVPFVKPHILFGNLKDSILVKKSLGEMYEDLYWKLDGYKFGGIFIFGQPALLLRDPEVIKDVLVRDFTSFHDNDIHVDLDTDPMFGRNPFVLPGEQWKITRSQLMPAFTVARIKPLFPLVNEVCQELKDVIEKSMKAGELETKDLCCRFTTDVVASCAFGIQGNSLKDPNTMFRQMGKDMLEPTFFSNLKIMTVLLLPRLANVLKVRLVSQKVEDFFHKVVKDVVSYREENKVTRNDYIQHLINLKNKSTANDVNGYQKTIDKTTFTDIDVAAQAVTFFADGFETSAATLSFALYSLATNPDVQNRAREEVLSVMKKYGGELTFDAIQEMPYLDLVLAESLRKYPIATHIRRVCTRPFKLETPSGSYFTVEVGTPVVIPVYALHYDSQYYPDPQKYDLERFNEENKKNRHKYVYLPFGEGPRICLGMRFAGMQVKAGIATILSKFEICQTTRTPVSIVQDPNYFLLASKGGLWLEFRKKI